MTANLAVAPSRGGTLVRVPAPRSKRNLSADFSRLFVTQSTPLIAKEEITRKTQSLPRFPPSEVLTRKRSSSSGKELRIVILGETGVGKTALVVRFLTRRFIGDYAHCEHRCACTTVMDAKPLRLWIQDTVDDAPISSLEEHIRWGDAFVLVFSVTSLFSFRWVEPVLEKILELKTGEKGEKPPLVIIGNKNDLCHLREVHQKDMQNMESRLNYPVIETSASDSYASVVEAFTNLFEQVLKLQSNSKNGEKKGSKKNGTSRIAQLRDTLRSLADFRSRTNTF